MIKAYSREGLPLWQQLIISRHPSVFVTTNPEIKNSSTYLEVDPALRINLRYGLEIDSGWGGLVEEIATMAEQLTLKLTESKIQDDAWIRSHMVRSKFAELIWSGDSNIQEPFRTLWFAYLSLIRQRSRSVCEICSRPGKPREVANWWTTLCDEDYRRECRSKGVRLD